MKKKKTEILQFRLTPEDLETIETGAKTCSLDLSDYIRMNVLQAAKHDIEKATLETKVVLTPEEWARFMDLMNISSSPNPHLKQAFKKLDSSESAFDEQSYG